MLKANKIEKGNWYIEGFSVIIILTIALCWHGLVYAEELKFPHITVYGTATKKVAPNIMVWHLTVKNEGENLQKVAISHTKHVKSVLDLLNKLNVSTEGLQTDNMEFGKNWIYKNNSQEKQGYFASTAIVFEITDFQKYKPLWIGLSQLQNVTVNGTFYNHSKRIDFQKETRKKALTLAREKAIELAKVLDSEIGEPLLIEENEYFSKTEFATTQSLNSIDISENTLSKGEEIVPGKIPIRIKVKAIFKLITHPK